MSKWSAAIALATASFVMLLDSTVMNVSINDVVSDLHTTVTKMQLAITTYTLVMAAFVLVGGKLGDIIGRRLAFRIGVVVFALGAGITAVAQNITVLILGWSILEGLGAALILPAVQALAAGNYAGRDRATAYGILGSVAAAGAAAGPIIGGLVATAWSWRVVFGAEVVIMLVLLLASGVIRDAARPDPRPRLDGVGAALSATGLALVVLGVCQSTDWGWIRPKGALTIDGTQITPFGLSIVPFLIVGGLAALGLFVVWERRRDRHGEAHLVDLALLRIRVLRSGLLASTSVQLALAGLFFVLPLYLQIVLGQSPIETGVRILPMSLGVLGVAALAAPLSARFPARRIVQAGLVVLLAGVVAIVGTVGPQLDGVAFGVSMLICGLGMGLVFTQLDNVVMSSAGSAQSSELGGLQGTAQNFGGALGTALIGAILLTGLGLAFNNQIQDDTSLSPQVRSATAARTQQGLQFAPAGEIAPAAESAGLPASEANDLAATYEDAQLDALKVAVAAIALLVLLALWVARRLPLQRMARGDPDASST